MHDGFVGFLVVSRFVQTFARLLQQVPHPNEVRDDGAPLRDHKKRRLILWPFSFTSRIVKLIRRVIDRRLSFTAENIFHIPLSTWSAAPAEKTWGRFLHQSFYIICRWQASRQSLRIETSVIQ